MNDELYKKTEYALRLLSEGNEEGIDLLYECMGRTMLFVARGILSDNDAEDAVQESFLKIVRNIDKYRPSDSACGWVCRIVRNQALNMLKKEKKSLTSSLDDAPDLPSPADTEETEAAKLTVEQLLKRLNPPVVRQMIYMKYFLDMTVREIAAETGMSKSFVAKKIADAEKQMKNML